MNNENYKVIETRPSVRHHRGEGRRSPRGHHQFALYSGLHGGDGAILPLARLVRSRAGLMADTHYVPVSEQRYARILQVLENHPDPLGWDRAMMCRLSGNIDGLVSSANNLGPGETPIAMAVHDLLTLADALFFASTINPPQIAAQLASYVRRD